MKLLHLLCFILLISVVNTNGQNLPKNYHYDPDNFSLSIHMENESGFYDLDQIEAVDLEFYNTNYWNLLHQNYDTENYIPAKLSYKGVVYDSVAVQFKGQTSYRRAKQQGSSKFSFDIKMGYYKDDQEVEEYSTLNFNNAFDDDSFLREVIYGRLAGNHIPAPRGNFIELSLNGENWGLYVNVQQVNNDMVGEWFPSNDGIRWRADAPSSGSNNPPPPGGGGPQWGDGTAALNFLGKDTTEYQKYYTLKSSDLENPWSYLVNACEQLDAPYSATYLEEVDY